MNKQLKDYITFKLIGECDIEVDEVIKHYNLCCRIYERDDTYELIEYTPRMKRRKFKVLIHKEDALKIINTLELKAFTSYIFGPITTYVPVGI